jgi:hypothetical protein
MTGELGHANKIPPGTLVTIAGILTLPRQML